MAADSSKISSFAGILLRLAVPCAILAAGWYGFQLLSDEIEKPEPPQPKEVLLRSRVEEIYVGEYPIVVKTHAVVQPHNQVVLNSQVSGMVTKISPTFEVGAYFNKGDVLVEIDPSDYESELSIAESELEAARSEFKLAKLVEERKLRLIESNAVSQGEVATASASREQAEANIALAETKVEQAKLNLKRTKIVAPFDGRVMSKLIGIGQLAGTNSPLGEVFAIDYVEVRLPISGDQRGYLNLPEFAEDAPLAVRLMDGLQQSDETVWQGKIVRTEGVLDPNSRDLFAIARVDDPFGRKSGNPPLRIGQPVVAAIDGKVLRNVATLPRSAVRQLDQIVLVDQKDQTLLPMKITALWSDADNVIVSSSVIPKNMWLATTPMPFTPKGTKIEIIPPTDTSISIAESASLETEESVTN
ncbi:efflux RND transporter periplasmic adaptor subunit [Bremerella cremea]|uniref:Efflux RND transporter periplasmic adaptor subunit n=1 Tax=Blastopirellula marina TaxID=124 RepID=A0A2S8FCC2_9BACT|nr:MULTISPECIES: efflux RND transporter periplasmic adaptor subunit [Pirellulaceae]PQO29770.1 efflux RND transporter periplasmic adaptor subunit [Blastopirellula marina]RCS43072.1 efflux RND transporter periplasmic adaptor subunit [Bremerella cremea]